MLMDEATLEGRLTLSSSAVTTRELLLMLSGLQDPMCIALRAESPWSWVEIWVEDVAKRADHLCIRFLLARRETAAVTK